MENYKPIVELELYLIRHGQSHSNAGYGKDDLTLKEANDPYLTELGLSQAERLGDFLSEIQFDCIYSSALLRAVQTANEIIKRQGEKKTLNIHPLLTEVSVNPEYRIESLDEIRSICPTASLADGVSPNDPLLCYNEYEDEAGMFERAVKVIEYLRSHYQNGERVAVVAHAAFLTFLVFSLMGFKEVPDFDIDFSNTSVTKVVLYKHGTNRYSDTIFEQINNTAHLNTERIYGNNTDTI